jgi:riboflavin biosynthesis pyrimidine reductase
MSLPVRRLKATCGGSLVTFGGVHTVRSLVAGNLVDEYWLKVDPAICCEPTLSGRSSITQYQDDRHDRETRATEEI